MILHRIVATNVGPFVGPPVIVGPFAAGLNILAAPNESGKTTLLKAAGRTLFDRHTCKADEIKALRPAGTSLVPNITVEFETATGRFQIEKTFLQGPRSQLSEHDGGGWKLVADGDSADDRLNALLQSTKPGSGATKAAHWGLLGYLWMRQGELAEWPEWHRLPTGQVVQGMLVKVEIDSFIESVRERMWSVFTENFTPATHQPKVGGTLLAAEGELARVEAELAGIAQVRQQLQADQEVYDRLSAELPRLMAEHDQRRKAAETLREAVAQARIVQVEVDGIRQHLAHARERLKAVGADGDALRDHLRRLEELAARVRGAGEDAARCGREASAAQQRLRAAETAQEENAVLLSTAQAEQTRASRWVHHRYLSAAVARNAQTLERSVAHAATVARLAAERAGIPDVPPAKLTRLEKLQEGIVTARARLEALGLTVELIPWHETPPVAVQADEAAPALSPTVPAGQVQTVRAAQSMVLELPGWGIVRLRSGAGETRSLRASLAADEETLRQLLADLGVDTIPAARALAEQARDLDRQIAAAKQALAASLGAGDETLDALRARLARDRRQLELLSGELDSNGADASQTAFDPERAEQAAIVRCEACRADAKTLERRIKEAREAAVTITTARERAERAVLLLGADAENLRRAVDTLRARYPEGLEAALQLAGEDFAVASLACKTIEAKLPPEMDTLPERSRRAMAAAEQVSLDLERVRTELAALSGRLERGGASGLHGREGILRAQGVALQVQVAQSRARSRAARLVHDLIERRQEAATRAVLAPLQERLGARFAEISGKRERRIFLDESLTVRGLGRKDGELVNFDDLSQGAKEQLLLCLRLSIAEELAANGAGPQSLILDDVLVNTDAARQERVLTLLANAAAQGLQILVCTCHPDRYRGTGRTVTLAR